ncbi:hypothetical protein SOM61_22415 [Massilia sp. CFBP9012]|uniref:hypothetical protein n=1 Tax=Massilia sp. CFBP9012 TaxID=3096531 RepID=UPI002A69DA19|nr:hypothetical protein [Massilia sp. CFBP9012]MDY0977720.1 hypothetical protein [Massilia sp. CFBP9012]
MATATPMDLSKDNENHPEISQLVRGIMYGDPFVFAEGSTNGVPYVILGTGPDDQFTFTKTADGYTFKKTK